MPKKKAVKKIEEGKAVALKNAETGEEVPVALEGVAEQEEPIEETVEEPVVEKEASKRPKKRKPTDKVKVKVIFGSVIIDGTSYEVGDVFTTSRERAATIDKRFIQIVEE